MQHRLCFTDALRKVIAGAVLAVLVSAVAMAEPQAYGPFPGILSHYNEENAALSREEVKQICSAITAKLFHN